MFTFELYWYSDGVAGAIMNFYGDSSTAYFNYDEDAATIYCYVGSFKLEDSLLYERTI